MNPKNPWLIASGWMSIATGLAHLACIIGGPQWYLSMGAPPDLVQASERGDGHLAIMTAFISIVIFVWAIYAFSAAGLMKRLPFMRLALVAISVVLLVRGLSYFLFPIWTGWRPDLSMTFMLWSSVIVLIMGISFAVGTWKAWSHLSMRVNEQLS